ncbi:MAG: EcsC family protein, partial [Nocardioides sp.]|nr:EcsC family protein [Nocardioides sp.]
DLVALAWVQQRLVMHIAAAYGHDLEDKARIQEFLNLAGVDLMINSGGAATAGASTRFGIRAATKWAAGRSVEATKSMAQLVGARVAKRVFLKGIPVLNIPLGAVISDVSTRRLAKRAREYYRSRPRTAI